MLVLDPVQYFEFLTEISGEVHGLDAAFIYAFDGDIGLGVRLTLLQSFDTIRCILLEEVSLVYLGGCAFANQVTNVVLDGAHRPESILFAGLG